MKNINFYKKIFSHILTITLVINLSLSLFATPRVHAAFSETINYQGKLTDSSNTPVTDGTYNMEFKLYTVSSGGSAIWTETLTGGNKVQVTNGLFSIMLGSVTPFTGVDFNQPLYLGVKIESDSEMSPRKILGAVPASFYSKDSAALSGLNSSQFLRSDSQNATSSSSTFLNIIQTGAGKVAEFFGTASQTVLSLLSNGNVGVGTTTPFAKLSVAGNTYIGGNLTATGTITVGSLNGPLQAINGLVSATSTISSVYGGTGLSSYTTGDILYADNTGNLSKLGIGSPGQVLKVTAGLPVWGADQTSGGGGAGAWATTSDSLALYPSNTSNVVLVGNSATTTTSSILEVFGTSYFSNNVGIATTSPFAKLSVNGNGFFTGSLTATNVNATGTLSIASLTGVLLGTNGLVSASATSSLGLLTTDVAEGTNQYWTNTRFDTRLSATTSLPNITTLAGLTSFGGPVTATSSTLGRFFVGTTTPTTGSASSEFIVRNNGNTNLVNFYNTAGTSAFSIDNIGITTATQFRGARFLGGDGTASQAAYDFTNNSNGLGMYRVGTDILGFTTASTQRLVIDATGDVGIATSSPFAKFSVGGDAYIGGNLTATGTLTVDNLNGILVGTNGVVSSTATSSLGLLTTDVAEGTNQYWTNTRFDTRLSATTSLQNLATLAGLTSFGTVSATTTSLGSFKVGTDVLFVDINRRTVGIGTTTPFPDGDAGLHVVNSKTYGSGSGDMSIVGDNDVCVANWGSQTKLFNNLHANSLDTTAPFVAMKIYSDGSCGGTANTDIFGFSRNNAAVFVASTSNVTAIGNYSNSPLVFGIKGLEVGRFSSTTIPEFLVNGSVGIGTTSPYAKLSVVGAIVASNIQATSTTATNYFASSIGVGTTTPGSILGGGMEVDIVNSTASKDASILIQNNNGTAGFGSALQLNNENATYSQFVKLYNDSSATNLFGQSRSSMAVYGSISKILAVGNILDNPVIFGVNNQEVGRFAAVNHNFGIATTTPFEKLSIGGNAYIGGNLTATGTLIVGSLNGVLVGTNGTVSASATSSLGLLTTDVAEGTNQYWTNTRFDTRLSATTSLQNLATLAGLTSFGIGGATTTTAGGLQADALNVTSTTASSTFANGINLSAGCFAINGVCVGGSVGGSGTVNTGTTGQIPYYAGNGTAVTATSTIFIATNTNVGVGTSTPYAKLSVEGNSDLGNFATLGSFFATSTVATSTIMSSLSIATSTTVTQVSPARLNIQIGSVPYAGIRLFGVSGQTGRFFEALDSTATQLYGLSSNGAITSTVLQATSGTLAGIIQNTTNTNTTGTSTAGVFTASRTSSTGNTGMFGIIGLQGLGSYTSTGTQLDAVGVYGRVNKTGASGSITNAYSIFGDTPVATGGGTITNAFSGGFAGNVWVGGKLGVATTTPVSTVSIQGSLCVRNTGSCGTTDGTIYATTATVSGIDLAENYQTTDMTLGAGEIVTVDPSNPTFIKRASKGDVVIGIVSTAPGFLLGKEFTNSRPVALAGRVPLKVNNEKGAIAIGDRIGLSSISGVGVKVSNDSDAVAIALQPLNSDSGTIEAFIDLSKKDTSEELKASTLVLINDLKNRIDTLESANSILTNKITIFASSTNQVATTSDITENTKSTLFSAFLEYLKSFGIKISDTVASFKNIITETLTVGSKEKPAGITLYDEVTKEPYCLKISSGITKTTAGECGSVNTATAIVPVINSEVVITPIPTVIASSTPIVESTTTPVQTIVVATSTPSVVATSTPVVEPIITATSSNPIATPTPTETPISTPSPTETPTPTSTPSVTVEPSPSPVLQTPAETPTGDMSAGN